MASTITMKELLETGVHFGHRVAKWNPKMAPYIFNARNGIHILDLRQTLRNLQRFHDELVTLAQHGETVLFVGTKRQAQEAVREAAEGCKMPYVNGRWLGGTLTNWTTIRSRIETLKKLEKRKAEGDFGNLSKKERLTLERKIEKLQERLGGIRDMKNLPKVLVVVDAQREETAIKEANSLNIPVMALADTNANPDVIDYIIPANDDAVRAIKLVLKVLADAVREGHQMRKGDDDGADTAGVSFDMFAEETSDDNLLGESTLKNLKSGGFEDDE